MIDYKSIILLRGSTINRQAHWIRSLINIIIKMNHSQNIYQTANNTWQPKDDQHKFIFIDIYNRWDLFVVIFNTTVTALLLAYILMGFWKRKQMIPSHRPQKRLFVGLLLWALFSICQFLYAIITYVLNKEYMKDLNYTKIYSILDSIPPFILQTLFIYIPLNVTNNLLQLRADNGQTIKMYEIRFYQALKLYMKMRYVFLIPKFGVLIPSDDNTCHIVFKASIWSTVLDALICNAALLYMDWFIFGQLTEISSSDRKTLHRQIRLIAISCFSRWLVDIILIVYGDHHWTLQHTIVYLFIGVMVMHFIPVFFITKMHFPEEETEQIRSLMQSDKV